ncbi:MAG: hypothetical protein K2X38_14880 [Gemmataceae bacterium]|nr:hypothetical protein [Gemmataceae bacterium]
MSIFSEEHQDAIDKINNDGWSYLVGRVDRLNREFDGHGGVIGSAIALQVNGIEVWFEQGEPNLEWRIVGPNWNAFTQGFRLSVGADKESRSNRVICKPVDWYMLCLTLQIGLNMAQLGLAAAKVDYAQNH